jgi:N-acetylglutamate synthase-like GNAT family acetyltransferase
VLKEDGRAGGRYFGYLTEIYAEEQDVFEVLQLVHRFGRGEVLRRTAEQLADAAARGWLLGIRNLETDELISTALIELAGANFAELGSVVVHDDFRGFGQHNLLILARLAKLAECERFAKIPVSIPTNVRSCANVVAAGFQLLDPYPHQLLGPCAQCSKTIPQGKICCSDAYQLPPDQFRQRIREFLRLGRRVELRRSNGAELLIHLWIRPVYDAQVRVRIEQMVFGRSLVGVRVL